MKYSPPLKYLPTLACLLFLLWLTGFLWFTADALRPVSDAAFCQPGCDGIVALTGGQDRISTSIALLKEHEKALLLISGVNAHFTLDKLPQTKDPALPASLAARVTLGRRATSTIGNAHETAQWAREHALHHLLIVTAGYHMRRALLELHSAAPELTLTAYRVRPPALQAPLSPHSLVLLLREYTKLLGAALHKILHLPPTGNGLNH